MIRRSFLTQALGLGALALALPARAFSFSSAPSAIKPPEMGMLVYGKWEPDGVAWLDIGDDRFDSVNRRLRIVEINGHGVWAEVGEDQLGVPSVFFQPHYGVYAEGEQGLVCNGNVYSLTGFNKVA